MKGLFFVITFAVLLVGTASCQEGAAPVLSKAAFQEKMSTLPEAQLVDVRTPKEFEEGHLEGAVNIDYLDDEAFNTGIKSLDKNKPVLLYCRSGRRSAEAGRILLEQGFKEVYDLQGGYLEWTK